MMPHAKDTSLPSSERHGVMASDGLAITSGRTKGRKGEAAVQGLVSHEASDIGENDWPDARPMERLELPEIVLLVSAARPARHTGGGLRDGGRD